MAERSEAKEREAKLGVKNKKKYFFDAKLRKKSAKRSFASKIK